MLTDSRFAQVIYTLRVADAYLFAEARCRRAFYKPTHHAKRRAVRLDLKVDTGKAAGLPTMEAYSRRDPQIIQTYSPIFQSDSYATTTAWVTGPTASDLLNMNAALSEHITRTTQPLSSHETCDRLMYPTSGYEGPYRERAWPSDVPSDAVPYPDLSTHSSDTSASISSIITPVCFLLSCS